MVRYISIGLLIIGAVAFIFFMPFGNEPKPAALHIQFTKGFDNEEVEIRLDGNVVFMGKIKTGDPLNPAPQIWHTTFIGKKHKAEVVVHISPFIQEFNEFEVPMMES